MITFDLPKNQSSIIKVLGVGGGGSNAVSHMYNQGIRGVDFVICNTDAQALETSPVPTKIQLGKKGLGAGSIPLIGKEAAEENLEDIHKILEKNTKMLFITAGMGGGTGTGAAPVIASAAKNLGILTVGIVTLPFSFEGRKRHIQAIQGIEELKKHVDTLLIICNDKLRELHGDLKLSEAFHQADNILTTAAKGIAEIVTVAGYINVDFEDVKTVMENSGKAIMGSATAEGENRAIEAVKLAMSSPLLDDNDIIGANNILLYIASGVEEISMDEVTEITNYIQDEAGKNAEIIWGNGLDESLGNKIGVTLIATGFDIKKAGVSRENFTVHHLNDDVTKIPKTNVQPEKVNEIEKIQLLKHSTDKQDLFSKEKIKPKFEQEYNQKSFVFELNNQDTNYDNSLVNKNNKTEQESDFKSDSLIKMVSQKNIPDDDTNETDLELQSQIRIQKLRELSIKLKSPEDIEKMEKEPAYIRRKIELNEIKSNNKTIISKLTLSDDKNNGITLRENNSYLHENVD